MPEFSYVRARSVEEALTHLASGGARLHAGGTDLLGCLRDGVFRASKIVSISRVRELQGIEETADGGLRIGALTTLTRVAEEASVGSRYPALSRAASEAASPQLRNQGTLGGNLCQKPRCWYYRGEFHCLRKGGDRCYAVSGENQFHCILGGQDCFIVHPSDLAPVLVVYGAAVEIAGTKGKRRVPIEEFFVLPSRDVTAETVVASDEIATGVLLPSLPQGTRSSYRKVRARRSWDFALAGVALALRFDGETVASARIALAGAAPVPWRSVEAEQAITGKPLSPEVVAQAAAAAMDKAKPLRHNEYKTYLFRGLIEEELTAIASQA